MNNEANDTDNNFGTDNSGYAGPGSGPSHKAGHRHSGSKSAHRNARRGARFLAATLVVIGGTAAAASSAAAAPAPPDPGSHSAEGSFEGSDPVVPPSPPTPQVSIPTVQDLVGADLGEVKLPDGYVFPDDDADPELCDPDCEVDPSEEADGDGEEGVPCESADCPEEETPQEETTTTTPETTTSTTVYELDDVGVDVEDATQRKNEELAFTGSNLLLPLAGVGLVGAGVLVAALSLAARRRAEADAEADAEVEAQA